MESYETYRLRELKGRLYYWLGVCAVVPQGSEWYTAYRERLQEVEDEIKLLIDGSANGAADKSGAGGKQRPGVGDA